MTIESRLDQIYQYLVNETENRSTFQSKNKAEDLHLLLSVIEYIIDGGDDNPLDDIFSPDRS